MGLNLIPILLLAARIKHIIWDWVARTRGRRRLFRRDHDAVLVQRCCSCISWAYLMRASSWIQRILIYNVLLIRIGRHISLDLPELKHGVITSLKPKLRLIKYISQLNSVWLQIERTTWLILQNCDRWKHLRVPWRSILRDYVLHRWMPIFICVLFWLK
jgi:hypothetical protein